MYIIIEALGSRNVQLLFELVDLETRQVWSNASNGYGDGDEKHRQAGQPCQTRAPRLIPSRPTRTTYFLPGRTTLTGRAVRRYDPHFSG